MDRERLIEGVEGRVILKDFCNFVSAKCKKKRTTTTTILNLMQVD